MIKSPTPIGTCRAVISGTSNLRRTPNNVMASASIFGQEKNPRGIPKAPFIVNVEEYIGGSDGDVEGPLKGFQDAIAKYRYMDANLTQRRKGLEDKIPDIKKTLHMVEYLQEIREGKQKTDDGTDELEDEDDIEEEVAKKPLSTTFELNDTLYAEAQLEDTDTVYLWLGVGFCSLHFPKFLLIVFLQANVMLSYKLPAAISLLRSKLGTAEASLKATIEDLEFLREQLTVMEVNTARMYNWDVKRRRGRSAEPAGKKKLNG
ncbi:Prefoldin subunit 3 [Butyriboletus roseoflavus]|nr:Prefoldin subunit 3 [Butyriboletus roseoflavus]